jgi:signal transduction histidine kinase
MSRRLRAWADVAAVPSITVAAFAAAIVPAAVLPPRNYFEVLTAMSFTSSVLIAASYMLASRLFRSTDKTLSTLSLQCMAIAWFAISLSLMIDLVRAGENNTSTASLTIWIVIIIGVDVCMLLGIARPARALHATALAGSVLCLGISRAYVIVPSLYSAGLILRHYDSIMPKTVHSRYRMVARTSLALYVAVGSVYGFGHLFNTTTTMVVMPATYVFVVAFTAKVAHLVSLLGLIMWSIFELGRKAEALDILMSQRQFVAQVAHELKTPSAELKLLADELVATSSGARGPASPVTRVIGLANRIEAIIDGAWRYLSETNYDPRAAHKVGKLPGLIEAALMSVKSTHKGAQVSFQADYARELILECNPAAMIQVFINLFNNSFEAFGEQGGVIRVKASRVRTDRGGNSYRNEIEVEYQDSGPGFPPGIETFVLDGGVSTKAEPGHGHGLCVARHILEDHDGTIRIVPSGVHSHGAQIIMRLPLWSKTATAQTPQ